MEEEGDPFLPGGVLYSLQLLTQQLLPPLTRNCVSKGQVKGASTPVLLPSRQSYLANFALQIPRGKNMPKTFNTVIQN